MTEVNLSYEPWPLQWKLHKMVGTREVIEESDYRKRFLALVAHRRFGKTIFGCNHCIMDSLEVDMTGREHAEPRYALIYPERKQGKQAVWDYLKNFGSDIPTYSKNESDLYIEFDLNGARIMIEGADNPDRIRSNYFDGVFVDEYADVSPELWTSVIYPALSDYNGWGIVTGTAKGENHFLDRMNSAAESDNWNSAVFPASEELKDSFTMDNEPDFIESTNVFSQEELDTAREEMEGNSDISDPEAAFKQEYGCHFNSAIRGAYYSDKLNYARKDDRIGNVPYESKLPVVTAWDLGVGDEMAIWFAQFAGKEIRLIDYFENSGEGLPFYFDVCRQKPYSYGSHLAPWDIEVREMSSGRTRKAIAKDHGFIFQTVQKHDVEDRIEAVRSILSRCWFDRQNCSRGIQALEEYRKEYNEELQKYKDKPLHNWASNGADAFGYLAMGMHRVSPNNDFSDENYEADTSFEVFA